MVANNAANDMSIYLNDKDGTGHYSAALRAGLYYGARSPWCADFNGDGHCEVAALVSLPPSGGSAASVILQSTGTGLRTGGAGRVIAGVKDPKGSSLLNLSAMPNPFSQSTGIRFIMPKAGFASLTVYNMMGQPIATPVSGNLAAGSHTASLVRGSLPAGTYLARLVAGGASRTITLVVE